MYTRPRSCLPTHLAGFQVADKLHYATKHVGTSGLQFIAWAAESLADMQQWLLFSL